MWKRALRYLSPAAGAGVNTPICEHDTSSQRSSVLGPTSTHSHGTYAVFLKSNYFYTQTCCRTKHGREGCEGATACPKLQIISSYKQKMVININYSGINLDACLDHGDGSDLFQSQKEKKGKGQDYGWHRASHLFTVLGGGAFSFSNSSFSE